MYDKHNKEVRIKADKARKIIREWAKKRYAKIPIELHGVDFKFVIRKGNIVKAVEVTIDEVHRGIGMQANSDHTCKVRWPKEGEIYKDNTKGISFNTLKYDLNKIPLRMQKYIDEAIRQTSVQTTKENKVNEGKLNLANELKEILPGCKMTLTKGWYEKVIDPIIDLDKNIKITVVAKGEKIEVGVEGKTTIDKKELPNLVKLLKQALLKNGR